MQGYPKTDETSDCYSHQSEFSLSTVPFVLWRGPIEEKGTTIRPRCWHQTVSFFLRIPLSSDGVDSFLPTRKPNYNHSATKRVEALFYSMEGVRLLDCSCSTQ